MRKLSLGRASHWRLGLILPNPDSEDKHTRDERNISRSQLDPMVDSGGKSIEDPAASLSGYDDAIQQDPSWLAHIAIVVSLSKARHMEAYVSNLTRQANPRASVALRDYFSNMDNAEDEIDSSLTEMRRLVVLGSEPFKLQMGNLQTWMSAALMEEKTSTDGFEDVVERPLKTAVCKRAMKILKKLTSNALALVNSYEEKVQINQ
ncbi:21 kDa protein-like [Hibiscus syriacus]|uniref:21 kDa protein-like n=1 Tax=Hibiscus syriacus TaxID=106335 RepID=UPI00192441AA|nr:21 kDa protein-like [Hibiscus syriacus]